MFRTIKVKLMGNTTEPVVKTAALYTKACQASLNYGFKNKTYNKGNINTVTYTDKSKREELSELYHQLWYNVQETKHVTYSNERS